MARRKAYRAALETKPDLGEANNNLAVVILLTKRPAEAKEQLSSRWHKKNGFRVPDALKREIDAALARPAAGATGAVRRVR